MELILQTIANGLIASAFYAIIAVGLSLTFGVMNTVNYAHGEFYMIGAYTVWQLYAIHHWPFFLAVGIATILVGLLGIIVERIIFRPVRGKALSSFIISVGMVFIIQVFVARMWGVGHVKPVPAVFKGALDIFGVTIGWQRVIILPSAVIVFLGFFYFLRNSKWGRALRAVALDSEAASLYGINVNKCAAIALGIGSAMAGLAGALMAPIMSVTPYMGHSVIWTCFVVVIVGGAGNIKGTIIAALVFGYLNTIVSTIFDSTVASIVSSVFMLTFLSIRPQGILGYAEK
ncbi:MAG: branched-chain amino acid ABC transporter permease [Desulfobacterales bacterium]|nr:branched-chain amino acid ABC transporter permease [Desulfobacterales bacterium]